MKNKLTVWDGVLSFATASVILLLLVYPLYYLFGAWYTAATEILLALSAILYAKIRKADLRKVFPLRLPGIRLTVASGFLFGGAFFVSRATSYFVYAISPALFDSASAEAEVLSKMSPLYALLVVALLPAICEELLCRGLWLSSLSKLKKDWLISLVSGLAFGALHFDLGKLLPIAVLGFAFSYMTLKTRSIIPSIICHYLNNIILLSSVKDGGATAEYFVEFSPATYVGSGLYYLGIGAALVFVAWFIAYKDKRRLKFSLISLGLCFLITVSGIASSNLTSYHEICTADAVLAHDDLPGAVTFSIERDAEVVLSSSATASGGRVTVMLSHEGEKVYSLTDDRIKDERALFLEAGKYVVYYSLESEDDDARASVYIYIYQNGEYAEKTDRK